MKPYKKIFSHQIIPPSKAAPFNDVINIPLHNSTQ